MPLHKDMLNEIHYISIKEVVSRVLRHPMLQGVNLEAAIQYTVDFIQIVGVPKMYLDKEATLEVKDYRAPLPCDVVAVNMVKHRGVPLRSMTETFFSKERPCHPQYRHGLDEETFRTQNSIIYTSFKEGKIEISYKAFPVDEEGYPLLPDNTPFLKALELYIKVQWFGMLFDLGKIDEKVLNHTEQQYAWAVGQCVAEFTIPSPSEMESITRMWNTLIPRVKEFDKGFRPLGSREYIRNQ